MNTERSVCIMLLILEKSDQTFSIKEASCPVFPLCMLHCECLLLGKRSEKLRTSPHSVHSCKYMRGIIKFRQLRLTHHVGVCMFGSVVTITNSFPAG